MMWNDSNVKGRESGNGNAETREMIDYLHKVALLLHRGASV